jgi:hypothetical protein
MSTAPRGGWIEVTTDGKAWTRVRYYATRVRQAGSVAWVLVTCWSTSDPGRLANRVDEPIGWRYPQP